MTIQFPAMADIKPTLLSTVVVGLMAVTFILTVKYIANRFNLAALQTVINAV